MKSGSSLRAITQTPKSGAASAFGVADQSRVERRSLLTSIALLFTALSVALLLRFPQIGAGMPYFYDEDEAHHFNRVVEMVQKGEFNPHYFHKPSLHFYLRMPVVMLAFLSEVRAGNIRSIKEIRTRDSDGLAGYSFSASHPAVAKWNRAFSVLLSLGQVALVFLISLFLFQSPLIGAFAALLSAFSPSLIADSAKIGVDGLMTALALLTTYLGLLYTRHRSIGLLIATSIIAGLAISSKYNALPIVLIPIIAAFFGRTGSEPIIRPIAIALLLPLFGFLVGSPFILVSLPLFLDHLAYEIWHYGVAGHAGHSAQPGFAQALFYGSWVAREALGYLPLLAALVGAFLLLLKDRKVGALALAFPLFFFLLMIDQKTNFTRNMLVIIPYLSIFAAAALNSLRRKVPAFFLLLLGAALLIQPVIASSIQWRSVKQIRESRQDLRAFILDTRLAGDTAISGELQPSKELLSIPGVTKVPENSDPSELSLLGYDQFAAPSAAVAKDLISILSFEGFAEKQRIVRNPSLSLYKLAVPELSTAWVEKAAGSPYFRVTPHSRVGKETLYSASSCPELAAPSEIYCWIRSRISLLEISSDLPSDQSIKLTITAMSPWPNQTLFFSDGKTHTFTEAGKFEEFSITLPGETIRQNGGVLVRIDRLSSPSVQGIGEDERRLGVAVQKVTAEGL